MVDGVDLRDLGDVGGADGGRGPAGMSGMARIGKRGARDRAPHPAALKQPVIHRQAGGHFTCPAAAMPCSAPRPASPLLAWCRRRLQLWRSVWSRGEPFRSLAWPPFTVWPLLVLAACSPAREDLTERWQVPGGDPVLGRRLMAQYQCGSCHVIPNVAAHGSDRGPSLQQFGRRSYIAGELPNTPDHLQRWLLDPPGQVPGTPMPRLGLSEQDARHIAAALMAEP